MRRWICMVLALVTASLVVTSPALGAARAFSQRFSANDTGNITMVANTLLTCPDADPQCAAARAQTASGAALNNNFYVMRYVNTDPGPGVFASSSADLSLPAGATVLKAMLYYGADSLAGDGGAPPPAPLARNTVLFKAPGDASYAPVIALQVDDTTTDGNDYQGVVDVTGQVSAGGSGTYSVANVQAGTGEDRQAGWSLVVAYHDSNQPPRNLTIFDGFQVVNAGNRSISIPVSGFKTPPTGARRTQLGFVAYEGDAGSTGDSTKLNTTTLSDASNPANNFFNSAISRDGAPFIAKNPNYRNQLGFDAILANADNVLANNDTSAVIRLTTGGETYFPGAVTFATELFAPDLQLAKSVQDLNGGQVQPGDTLRYTVSAANTGEDDATNVVLTDPIPTNTTFVGGSLRINGVLNPPEASFDANNNQAIFNVGTTASATRGGTLPGPAGTAVVSFDVTVDTVASGAQIANAASAAFFAKTLGVPLTADSNEVTSTVSAPDLTVAKTPPTFTAVGGGTAVFTLTVTNGGDAPTDGSQVTVTDAPPAAVFDAVTAASGTGWTCSPATPVATPVTISCNRTTPSALAPGASYPGIQITVSVVGLPPAGNLLNTASVAGGGDADTTNNSSTSVGQATTRADLQILKTADPTTALTGEQVTFTMRVRNGGPSTAQAVQVTDTDFVPNYTVDSVSSSQGGCTALPCTLGTMAAGDEATVTVRATVVATGAAVVPAANTASVASTTIDPDPTNDSSTAGVDVAPTADLAITKVASPSPLDTTAPAQYTLTVDNAGPQPAANTVVTDPLPAGFTFVAATPSQGTCSHSAPDNTVICALGTIASGANATITIDGTLAPSLAATFVSNSARVGADTGDPDLTDNIVTNTTLAIPAADLELAKFADDSAPQPGGTVTFTLQLTNHGPSIALNARVTDTLPAGLTLVSAPGCTAAGASLTCDAGALASGATQSFSITVRVGDSLAAGTEITNTATATSDTPDPIPANNTDAWTLTIAELTPSPPPPPPSPADVAVSKRTLDASRVGQNLRYAILVANHGPGTATGVTVTDVLPARVTLVSATATQGTCTRGSTVSCAIGDLAAAGSATVTVTVRPTRTGRLTNTASAASSSTDPNMANNSASVVSTVRLPSTSLRLRKTASRSSVPAGGTVRYRISVRNTGTAAASDVRVCDRPPSGLVLVRTGGAKLSNGQACWTIRTLARAKTRTFVVTARATGTSSARTLTNRARVGGANAKAVTARARVRVLPAAGRAGGVTG